MNAQIELSVRIPAMHRDDAKLPVWPLIVPSNTPGLGDWLDTVLRQHHPPLFGGVYALSVNPSSGEIRPIMVRNGGLHPWLA